MEVEGVPSAPPLTATWSYICMGTLQREGWPDHPMALLTGRCASSPTHTAPSLHTTGRGGS